MGSDLSTEELAMCIAALEHSANDIRDGSEASKRLGLGEYASLVGLAEKMDALRSKLLSAGDTHA